jgi:transcriptional regulator with XRE-family HTH domain
MTATMSTEDSHADHEKPAKQRATRLREALRRRGIRKLYGLALDLQVDQSTISRWTNDGGMSLDHVAALCAHLNISLDWLIFGRGTMEIGHRSGEVEKLADLAGALEPELTACFATILKAIVERR